MKILLLLGEGEHNTLPDEFYSGLHKKIGSVDLRRLGQEEQAQLKLYFTTSVNLNKYDRVVMNIDFDVLPAQLKFLQSIHSLVFIDSFASHDRRDGVYKNRHLNFYKQIPWARIIVNSFFIMSNYLQAGLDVCCVPKGYSSTANFRQRRLDSTATPVDEGNIFTDREQRQRFLDLVVKDYQGARIIGRHAEITLVDVLYPGYKEEQGVVSSLGQMLSSIRLVIFPDINRGEYRTRLFEAMADGALVLSYNHGDIENRQLGLIDMKNIVLFNYYQEFRNKMVTLADRPDVAGTIADEGRKLVEKNYRQYDLGIKAAEYIAEPTREPEAFRLGLSVFGIRL